MYASVVVLTYQSPDIESYTYRVPESISKRIRIGQVVSVPFGNRNPLGLVIGTSKEAPKPDIKIKEISSIVLDEPLLLPYQIELLKWMRNYYLAPMVNCLEAMIPSIPRKLSIVNSKSTRKLTINQTLVLVPNINRIPEILASYPKAKNYLTYHNELPTKERFTAWQKIKTGDFDFVFGSRSAIFAPCPNLSKIIIYDEHDWAYKDERSPYFDTLTVAEKIKELTGATIKIVDSSPKVVTFKNHSSEIIIPKTKVKTFIVSMIEEKNKGNRLPISDLLVNSLKKNTSLGDNSLLFLNKKAQSGYLYCRNCKYQEYLLKEPQSCPSCKSVDIWFNSLNVVTLANLVRKMIPRVPVRILTKETMEAANFQSLKGVIDIGTASVFYGLATQSYPLVAHVATDAVLNVADFAASESAFIQIATLKKVTAKYLILQTYNPDNVIVKLSGAGNYLDFFESQLKERQLLSYPPYGLLVKLTQKGKRAETLERNSRELYRKLSTLLPTDGNISLLGPYKPIFSENALKTNLIIKTKLGDYSLKNREKAITYLKNKLLNDIGGDVQIMVEPASFN